MVRIRTKTEQRIAILLRVLQEAEFPLSYEDLRRATGAYGDTLSDLQGGIPPDALLYILATLQAVGMVSKSEAPPLEGSGACRPRYMFSWAGERVFDLDRAVNA